ncbi:MAG: Ig-like domain-containing protein, partial [Blastocatellia bacterium]
EQGELHPGEKRFVQSIVNRFEHHQNLVWCVMEEGQEIGAHWQRHISKIAAAIREADDHDHAIASHQLAGNTFFHADDPNLDQFAIQTHDLSVKTRAAFHDWLVEAWCNAAGRYNLNMSEDRLHREMCRSGDRAGVRQRNWAAAMAGAYVMVLGMDGAETPIEWLQDCRRLQQFFESTDFYRMQPADELKREETEFVLAAPGLSFIAYSAAAKRSLGLKDLPAGEYDWRWYDCATGQSVERTNVRLRAGDQRWPKPRGFSSEVALYLKRRGSETDLPPARTTTAGQTVSSAKPNRPPAVKNKSHRTKSDTPFDLQLTYVDPDGGPGPYTTTVITEPGFGALSGAGNDLTYTPRRGYSGADRFTWKVNDGRDDSAVAVVAIVVDGQRSGKAGQKAKFYFPPPGEALANQARRKPEEVWLKPEVIGQLKALMKNGRWALWRHGYLAHVEGDFNQKTEVASLRKTWHALAVGAAIKQGKIPSYKQKLSVWNRELTGKDAEATWRHV